jgi:hypothetical protein
MKTYFWEETPGNQSASRLIFMVGSVWAMAICTVLAIKFIPIGKISVAEIIALFSAIEGLLVGLKVGQKALESNATDPPIPPKG